MRPYPKLFLATVLSLCLTAPAAMGDETHVDVQIDSRGMSEEIIRLREHAYKMEKEERQRIEKRLEQLSTESLDVGNLYLENGEFYIAIDYYRQAIYLNGGNSAAHEKLIEAARLRDAYELQIGAHYHRAMDYYRQGMDQKAIEELVAAIKKNPENEAAVVKLNEIESRSAE